jgi:hypothetical protein
MSDPNWVNEILDRASREVSSWPEWMRRPEVRGQPPYGVVMKKLESVAPRATPLPLDRPPCPRCHKNKYDPKYATCFACRDALERDERLLLHFAGFALQGLSAHHGMSKTADQIAEEAWARARAMVNKKP